MASLDSVILTTAFFSTFPLFLYHPSPSLSLAVPRRVADVMPRMDAPPSRGPTGSSVPADPPARSASCSGSAAQQSESLRRAPTPRVASSQPGPRRSRWSTSAPSEFTNLGPCARRRRAQPAPAPGEPCTGGDLSRGSPAPAPWPHTARCERPAPSRKLFEAGSRARLRRSGVTPSSALQVSVCVPVVLGPWPWTEPAAAAAATPFSSTASRGIVRLTQPRRQRTIISVTGGAATRPGQGRRITTESASRGVERGAKTRARGCRTVWPTATALQTDTARCMATA